eukprot:TRINITY_DN10289_c0_g1_i1.p2 TRINITY_DN10289_c0_g1~~TRINITY_DN10289_c0_g1_i1.p2  ORF type:complete len:107 (-),score=27.77 TRINITY_DN10289_c0_g1_i1:157-477(-)
MRVLTAAFMAFMGVSGGAIVAHAAELRGALASLREEPAAEEAAAPADGEGAAEVREHTYTGYDKDWHNEYGNGEIPTWKQTLNDYHIPDHWKYEDSQSDGEPSKAR